MTLLETQNSSSSATLSFTSNIDSTYKEYIFKFIDVHPATDQADLQVNFRDGSTAYDATKTTTNVQTFQGLGATSLLILVGVAIDTAKQVQTYVISQRYEGLVRQ